MSTQSPYVSPAMREALASLSAAAGNESAPADEGANAPYFFIALDRQRPQLDHCGTNWERALAPRLTGRLAGAHRQSLAVCALASLLMADFETGVCGADEPRLSALMREGLFLGLKELADSLHDTLSVVGEHLQFNEAHQQGETA